VAREPSGLVGGEARIGLAQALRYALGPVVALQRHLALVQQLDLVHPLRIVGRRGARVGRGHAEAFEIDQAPDARRARTRVVHGHIAAHAVPDQVHGTIAREMVEQKVQIGQVIDEQIVVARCRRLAQAKAPPVGRDDGARAGKIGPKRIDHELVRSRHVHPAVQQHERRRLIISALAPQAHVVVEGTNAHEGAAGRAEGLVHGRIISHSMAQCFFYGSRPNLEARCFCVPKMADDTERC